LEGALGHEKLLLLIRRLVLGQTMSINEPEQSGQTSRVVTTALKTKDLDFDRAPLPAPLPWQLSLEHLTESFLGVLNHHDALKSGWKIST
jgi:hypothetical protein